MNLNCYVFFNNFFLSSNKRYFKLNFYKKFHLVHSQINCYFYNGQSLLRNKENSLRKCDHHENLKKASTFFNYQLSHRDGACNTLLNPTPVFNLQFWFLSFSNFQKFHQNSRNFNRQDSTSTTYHNLNHKI
jgi:hypothetical protein